MSQKDRRVIYLVLVAISQSYICAVLRNELAFTHCVLGANFGARVRALDVTKRRDNAAVQSSGTAIYCLKAVCPCKARSEKETKFNARLQS